MNEQQLHEVLQQQFGFDDFRPGQQPVIEAILNHQDTLAILPTGAGKTLLYQLPARILPGSVIVISPLLSLMQDQVNRLRQLGEKQVTMLSSIQTRAQQQATMNHLAHFKYIFASPETITKPEVMAQLKQIKIAMIVIDEAHCVSQWGPEFRPQYLLLKTLLADVSHDVTLMLTATATQRVQDDILIKLGLRVRQVTVVRQSVNRPNIFLSVQTSTSQTDKQTQLLQLVKTLGGAGIVYFSSRKQASQVAQWLQEQTGLNVAAYHAGMSQTTRYKIQHQFMNNQLQVICATSAFGMGIDKEDIRFVIHYHVPANLENYVQEIGRAGRDGQQSLAVILYSPGDEYIQVNLSDLTIPSDAVVNDFMSGQIKAEQLGDVGDLLDFYRSQHLQTEQIIQIFQQQRQKNRHNLDQLLQYVNTTECRRAVILNYFGEQLLTHNESCCDGFDNPLNIEQLGLKKIEKTSIKQNVQSWQSRLNQLYFVKS
jgi:ATP-dependent DNA helicase RecQ